MGIEISFAKKRSTPWDGITGVDELLSAWRSERRVWDNVVLDELLEGTGAKNAPMPEALDPRIRGALEKRGVTQLYSHQAHAFELSQQGRDFVVATPTASGKSLCYVLPVLQALAQKPQSRALFLFPTKALSRDQEEAVRGLMKDAGLDHGAITFDGDTPADARRAARERSGIILSNPDMLHAGVLPHHAGWARFFAGLEYVVIDELHAYRGVFGSHLANVLRRLDRIARFHGGKPKYLMASATIGNPQEHASRMLGREVSLVTQSGAPRGDRRVVLYNPPVLNPELGVRQSYVKASARLTTDLVKAGVPTLLFGQSRNTVEVMLKYIRDALAESRLSPELVLAYRAGYLPKERRDIERRLREGDVRCVVATSALELGIDVGSLDAVVCAGWPGSVAALWQRFGRAGRRQGTSLSLLVTSSAPVDQYVAATAKELLITPVEQARIDPDNVEILVQHLKCAAFELPFESEESFRDVQPSQVKEVLDYLSSHQVVHATGKTWHWSADAYPANDVSLRSVGWDNFVVVDLSTDLTIAEMDFRSTHTMLHEQAIYQHDGRQFQVEKLDFENHKAFVRPVEPDYFTDAMTYTKVTVLSRASEEKRLALELGAGDVSVVERVVGYKKIKFHTHENVGYGDVRLPELQLHTTAWWLTVPEPVMQTLIARGVGTRPDLLDALNGLNAVMHTVAAVGLMIDPRDLGRCVGSRDGSGSRGDAVYEPTLFLYDHVPGGVGLASRLFEERERLLEGARDLLERCACETGCPSCVGPNGRKAMAREVLNVITRA
ncbi:MAG: DEAD/DEAH box helicase [Archangium sp.]